MRYYNFKINTNADEIKDNARINLREYAYENTLASMNNYMYRNMKNDLTFLTYREEKNLVAAVFAYNEKKMSFQNAYDDILEMLNDAFMIKKIKVDPYEITIYQFLDCILEAKRRDYFTMFLGNVLFQKRKVRSILYTIKSL